MGIVCLIFFRFLSVLSLYCVCGNYRHRHVPGYTVHFTVSVYIVNVYCGTKHPHSETAPLCAALVYLDNTYYSQKVGQSFINKRLSGSRAHSARGSQFDNMDTGSLFFFFYLVPLSLGLHSHCNLYQMFHSEKLYIFVTCSDLKMFILGNMRLTLNLSLETKWSEHQIQASVQFSLPNQNHKELGNGVFC